MKQLTFKRTHYDFEHTDSMAYLCGHGVFNMFGVPQECNEVTFVLTKTKHPQAFQITWECDYDLFVTWTEAGIMYDYDYELHLDGIETAMYCDATDMMAELWQEGYNYVRAEYSA